MRPTLKATFLLTHASLVCGQHVSLGADASEVAFQVDAGSDPTYGCVQLTFIGI